MTQSKIAVVAGGSAGVGRATVEKLIAEGYKVGVLARGEDRLAEMEETYGPQVMTLPCDVSDAAQVSRAATLIEEGLGPIDLWINCAMLTSFSPFTEMKDDEFRAIVDTTFMGVVNGTRAALAQMEPRGRGHIVTFGSGLGYRAVPFQSAYCASKHAINGFVASVRTELIRKNAGITMSLVQLPALNTPQFDWARNRLETAPQPAPPIYQPEVAADAVMRAVHKGSRELFVGASVLQLVFGNIFLPDYLDKKMSTSGAEMQKSDRDAQGTSDDNLHGPVDSIPASAHGSYGERAKASGLIVDADLARLAVFGGLIIGTAVLSRLLPRR